MTAADLVIEAFAGDEVLLHERIRSLEEDCSIYRLLVCASFDALRESTLTNQRLRERLRQQQEEFRAFREHLLLAAGVEDSVCV